MKKIYAIVLLAGAATFAWCTFNAPEIPVLSTGDIQEMTGDQEVVQDTGIIVTDDIITTVTWASEEANFDSGEVPVVVAGSVSEEVKSFLKNIDALIKQRKQQPTDDSKLTEEDIDLMEKVIEELKNL